MARNQQSLILRQQVERLVTEGKTEEAFRLLKNANWTPGGSGHQEYYPNGLTLYAKVDWRKQILVSQTRRYWAWEVTLLGADQYCFLYPISRQFPFDEVCYNIVRELEKRNWEANGIQVEFDTYGTGAAKYRLVREIRSKDFKLHFGRCQKHQLEGHWVDTAGVSQINIPKMQLSVNDDESGPTLYVYVGENWQKDSDQFMNHIKVHSKMEKEPRTYLRYRGGSLRQFRRSVYLEHDNDSGREYDVKPGEPDYYETLEVMEKMKNWLQINVLQVIQSLPILDLPPKGELPIQPSMPESIGPLFCFVNRHDAQRINQGRENPASLAPSDRYGLTGDHERLVHLCGNHDGTIPEIAYDGFLWCGIGEITDQTVLEELNIPGFFRSSDYVWYLVKVTPKSANDIYIADISARESYKESISKANPEQKYLTEDQYQEYLSVAGRTIIPVIEYQNNFKKPVVLINRELSLDEVEVIGSIPASI